MPRILIASSVALALCACGSASFTQRLAGHWASASCEAASSSNTVKRDFVLTDRTWQLTATIFGDTSCTTPFVALDVGGNYDVGAASTSVSGATDVDYHFDHRALTPLSTAAADFLNGQTCGAGGWVNNQRGDISQTGCAALGVPSDASCPVEHDLNRIDGTQLSYGERSGNLCQARPAMLGSSPVTRQP